MALQQILSGVANEPARVSRQCCWLHRRRQDPRLNIIQVLIDDMGYADLGCYGGEAATPNIDRLAAEGIRFTQGYVASPVCSPSRVAITTGQFPARHLIYSYLDSRAAQQKHKMANWLDVKAPSIARTFQQAGYATGHFGKWHMGGGRDVGDAPLPAEYGFDETFTSFEGLGDRALPPGRLSELNEKLGRGNISTRRSVSSQPSMWTRQSRS